jgi:hypothetical protein
VGTIYGIVNAVSAHPAFAVAPLANQSLHFRGFIRSRSPLQNELPLKQLQQHLETDLAQRRVVPSLREFVANEGMLSWQLHPSEINVIAKEGIIDELTSSGRDMVVMFTYPIKCNSDWLHNTDKKYERLYNIPQIITISPAISFDLSKESSIFPFPNARLCISVAK